MHEFHFYNIRHRFIEVKFISPKSHQKPYYSTSAAFTPHYSMSGVSEMQQKSLNSASPAPFSAAISTFVVFRFRGKSGRSTECVFCLCARYLPHIVRGGCLDESLFFILLDRWRTCFAQRNTDAIGRVKYNYLLYLKFSIYTTAV